MARLKRLTGRRPAPAAELNPRSQAHPMPGWSSTAPVEEAVEPATPRDPVPIVVTPDPPGETRAGSPATTGSTDEASPAADEIADPPSPASTPTHAWTAAEQPYDRLDCPACGTIFRELPDAAESCPACGATIDVLTCPEGVRHLITAADLEAFDGDWDTLHGRRRREDAQRRNAIALQDRRATLAAYVELGFRLFELRTAPDACATCVAAAARTYRPRAAPALPIAGCLNDICRCGFAPARPSASRR